MKSSPILLVIILILLARVPSMAENKIDFATVDRLTYKYYNEKKWDSVIMIGKQALSHDIDYYYLRVRMGIAYFEKAKYFQAATHFKKARQFNSGDAFVADYLYRSFVYTNRNEEARTLRSDMRPEEQDTTLLSHGLLEHVHFETGYTISSEKAPEKLGPQVGNDSIYREQDLYGNYFYTNFGLKLSVSNRVGLSLAYNYLNFGKTKYIQYGRGEDYLQSDDTSFKYHVVQHEAYISAKVFLPWGIKIMPAFHLLYDSYPVFSNSNSLLKGNDTSFNNYLAALDVSKDMGRFNFVVHGSWSNLNNNKQKQIGLSLTYFPLGNLNFYGTSTVTAFFQGKEKRLLFSQILGTKITPWMWGEVNFYSGNYSHANIFNGSIVYNNSDIINYRGGATLVFIVGNHVRLSLIYQYLRKESQQLYYIKTQDQVTKEKIEIQQIKNNPYNTNTIIGGITWKL
ncbi:MAG: hypothetical protein Q8M08_08700 [Bacteroidales bacterium]|nr:hypothetical protein [Bacteroidales bacterium]